MFQRWVVQAVRMSRRTMMITLAMAIQKPITRVRRSVHQASFLNALCQALVRSTTHFLPAVTGAGLPRSAMSVWRPRVASSVRVLVES